MDYWPGQLIDFALKYSEHNIANAARMLGTSRPKIYRHLAKQGQSAPQDIR